MITEGLSAIVCNNNASMADQTKQQVPGLEGFIEQLVVACIHSSYNSLQQGEAQQQCANITTENESAASQVNQRNQCCETHEPDSIGVNENKEQSCSAVSTVQDISMEGSVGEQGAMDIQVIEKQESVDNLPCEGNESMDKCVKDHEALTSQTDDSCAQLDFSPGEQLPDSECAVQSNHSQSRLEVLTTQTEGGAQLELASVDHSTVKEDAVEAEWEENSTQDTTSNCVESEQDITEPSKEVDACVGDSASSKTMDTGPCEIETDTGWLCSSRELQENDSKISNGNPVENYPNFDTDRVCEPGTPAKQDTGEPLQDSTQATVHCDSVEDGNKDSLHDHSFDQEQADMDLQITDDDIDDVIGGREDNETWLDDVGKDVNETNSVMVEFCQGSDVIQPDTNVSSELNNTTSPLKTPCDEKLYLDSPIDENVPEQEVIVECKECSPLFTHEVFLTSALTNMTSTPVDSGNGGIATVAGDRSPKDLSEVTSQVSEEMTLKAAEKATQSETLTESQVSLCSDQVVDSTQPEYQLSHLELHTEDEKPAASTEQPNDQEEVESLIKKVECHSNQSASVETNTGCSLAEHKPVSRQTSTDLNTLTTSVMESLDSVIDSLDNEESEDASTEIVHSEIKSSDSKDEEAVALESSDSIVDNIVNIAGSVAEESCHVPQSVNVDNQSSSCKPETESEPLSSELSVQEEIDAKPDERNSDLQDDTPREATEMVAEQIEVKQSKEFKTFNEAGEIISETEGEEIKIRLEPDKNPEQSEKEHCEPSMIQDSGRVEGNKAYVPDEVDDQDRLEDKLADDVELNQNELEVLARLEAAIRLGSEVGPEDQSDQLKAGDTCPGAGPENLENTPEVISLSDNIQAEGHVDLKNNEANRSGSQVPDALMLETDMIEANSEAEVVGKREDIVKTEEAVAEAKVGEKMEDIAEQQTKKSAVETVGKENDTVEEELVVSEADIGERGEDLVAVQAGVSEAESVEMTLENTEMKVSNECMEKVEVSVVDDSEVKTQAEQHADHVTTSACKRESQQASKELKDEAGEASAIGSNLSPITETADQPSDMLSVYADVALDSLDPYRAPDTDQAFMDSLKPKKKETDRSHLLRKKPEQQKVSWEEELERKMKFEEKMRAGTAKLLAASRHPHQLLEAAKNLLTSNTRMMVYMNELQKSKAQDLGEQSGSLQAELGSRGRLSISGIRIPLMWKEHDYFKSKTDSKRFAVFCLVKLGTEVFDTTLRQDIDRTHTDVSFEETFVFEDIRPDFELHVEVYVHRISADDLPTHSTPQRWKKRLTEMGHSVGKRLSGMKEDSEDAIVGPKFDRIAESTLLLADVCGSLTTYNLILLPSTDSYNSDLPLFGTLCCRLSARAGCVGEELLAGTVSLQEGERGAINNYWARLADFELRCWKTHRDSQTKPPCTRVPISKNMDVRTRDAQVTLLTRNPRSSTMHILSGVNVGDWARTLQRHVRDRRAWDHVIDLDLQVEEVRQSKAYQPRNQARSKASLYQQTDVDSPLTKALNKFENKTRSIRYEDI